MKVSNINFSDSDKESYGVFTFLYGCCTGFLVGVIVATIEVYIVVFIFFGNEDHIAIEKAKAKEYIINERDFWGSRGAWGIQTEKPTMEKAMRFFFDSAKPDYDMSLYSEWMKDWLLQGNELDPVLGFGGMDDNKKKYYVDSDNNLKTLENFYIISDGAVITRLYGNLSVKILVPKGTVFEISSLGQNEVYYWDDNGVAKCEAKYPVLYPEVEARLRKMNIPKLNEALERNLKNKW